MRLNVAQKVEASPLPTTTGPVDDRRPTDPSPATVPDVVGDELADAARAFGDEVLKVSVQYVPSDEPQGRVVAQAQPAGTELEPGDTVQVNVSNGPEPAADTQVPDVVGLAAELPGARGSRRRGLRGARTRGREQPVTGEVVSQSPAGGALDPARLARRALRRQLGGSGYFGSGSSL